MKAFTISAAVALLAIIAQAAPSPARVDARQYSATITFSGADGAGYTLMIPADGTVISIDNSLSVSRITCGPPSVLCYIYGLHGSVTTCGDALPPPAVVGPPQPAVSVACHII
ncbi:hypothetical protein MMC29_006774 [Sticta canariensis]|nr:hypothetical protein [Sticta canariensis]